MPRLPAHVIALPIALILTACSPQDEADTEGAAGTPPPATAVADDIGPGPAASAPDGATETTDLDAAAGLPAARDPLALSPPPVDPELDDVDAASAWRASAWPAHAETIERMPTLLERIPGDGEAVEQAGALLARASAPQPAGRIDGDWQVRSLQFVPNFAHAYPWFRARIETDGDGYRFAKTTGSQRRTGRLLPIDGSAYAFLGARSVNDDPPRTYSRAAGGAGPSDDDSIGRLVRIGDDELLMLLDPGPGSFELYHLRRQRR